MFPKAMIVSSLLTAVFCASPKPAPTAAPTGDLAKQRAKPALVVFIAVDQLREDYLERWQPQFTSGLKRLVNGGAFFTNGHQDHAITETAPGHASMMSGRFPRSTGITRNLAGVNDPKSPLIGVAGLGASPFRFRGTTLTDWMTSVDPATRALSVSFKDRGAILPIGRSKQEVYWYSATGVFTTSTWYHDSLPAWVQSFNARKLPQSYAGKKWDLLLPANAYPEPDSVAVEAGGRGFVFPHFLSAGPDTAAAQLPGTPFIDEVTAALALAGVNALKLGSGNTTDMLAVSFSGTDLVGHRYGPDSREIHDQLLRLDRIIGGFIDSLYRLRDSTRIIFALTGDHGVAPFPELNNGRVTPAPGRISVTPAFDAALAVLKAAGADTTAIDLESGAFFVDRKPGITPALVNAAADSFVAAARRIPGVARSERFRDLASKDLGKDAIARRWVQMFPPDFPVEAMVVLTQGSYWANYPIAMHGTPYDYDTHVPIIFYGAPFKTGRYPQFVRTVDMGPTLAEAIGVVPSEPLDGRVLKAAIK